MIFSIEDFNSFKDWLDLDEDSIAWEGRHADSFNSFWNSFFKDQISADELSERFRYAKKIAKSGPLISWLNWLFDKFITYIYIHKNLSLREVSLSFSLEEKEVSTLLRNHLIKISPALEDLINEKFQVSNVISRNLFLKFEDIKKFFPEDVYIKGTFSDDILANIEVTLYPDWNELVKELRKDIIRLKIDYKKLKKKTTFKKQIKFFQEVILLLSIFSALVFVLKNTNKWYENYIVNKISLFEPNFFWLDKSLSYQDQDLLDDQKIDLSNKELEELERLEALSSFEASKNERRYDPESDVVVLDSVEDVPKSFGEALSETSDYEENRKGGYKDSVYSKSRKKAYRILLASVKATELKNSIMSYIDEYEISQVDNVKPGTMIPGGVYFNLHVPSQYLKKFMSKISALGETTIFESRSSGRDKPGKSRVFIWIKSI